MNDKYLVTETSYKGTLYKMFKNGLGWSHDPAKAWRFSRQEAERVVELNNYKVGWDGSNNRTHYSMVKIDLED